MKEIITLEVTGEPVGPELLKPGTTMRIAFSFRPVGPVDFKVLKYEVVPEPERTRVHQYPEDAFIGCEFCNLPASSYNYRTGRFSCDDHWDSTYKPRELAPSGFDEWNW